MAAFAQAFHTNSTGDVTPVLRHGDGGLGTNVVHGPDEGGCEEQRREKTAAGMPRLDGMWSRRSQTLLSRCSLPRSHRRTCGQVVFTVNLLAGLLLSQLIPTWLSGDGLHAWQETVQVHWRSCGATRRHAHTPPLITAGLPGCTSHALPGDVLIMHISPHPWLASH